MDKLLEKLEELYDARSSVGGEESSDTETLLHLSINQVRQVTKKTRKELPHGNSEPGLYPTNCPNCKPRSSRGVTNEPSTNKVAYSFFCLFCKYYLASTQNKGLMKASTLEGMEKMTEQVLADLDDPMDDHLPHAREALSGEATHSNSPAINPSSQLFTRGGAPSTQEKRPTTLRGAEVDEVHRGHGLTKCPDDTIRGSTTCPLSWQRARTPLQMSVIHGSSKARTTS